MNVKPAPLTLSIQDKTFAAELWGGEGIPVIALHGWLDNSQSFSLLAPELEGIQLLALDMAGHGHSAHRSADASYHIWDDVREVLLIADAMGWQQFSLLGHSRGAIISAMIAAVAPERILSLGLMEGLWPQTIKADRAAKQLTRFIHKFMNKDYSEKGYDSIGKMIAMREKGGFGLSKASAKILVERNAEQREGRFFWRTDKKLMMPSPMMLTEAESKSFIDEIQCPVKLVIAEKGMALMYKDYSERLKRYPRIECCVCEGGHHFHMGSQVKFIAEVLNMFFNDVHSASLLREMNEKV